MDARDAPVRLARLSIHTGTLSGRKKDNKKKSKKIILLFFFDTFAGKKQNVFFIS